MIQFEMLFAIFLGDTVVALYAKTGLGLVKWCPEESVAQMRLPGCGVDAEVPDLTMGAARRAGVRSLVIGSAAVGGGVPAHWVSTLREVAPAGIAIPHERWPNTGRDIHDPTDEFELDP